MLALLASALLALFPDLVLVFNFNVRSYQANDTNSLVGAINQTLRQTVRQTVEIFNKEANHIHTLHNCTLRNRIN